MKIIKGDYRIREVELLALFGFLGQLDNKGIILLLGRWIRILKLIRVIVVRVIKAMRLLGLFGLLKLLVL